MVTVLTSSQFVVTSRLAGAEPRDVVVAGAAVERVDLTVRSECVQDVVAVATELVVDAAAAPEEVAAGGRR